MEQVLNETQLIELRETIDKARKVVCVAHVNPDGDALGVTLAIRHWMERKGKLCTVIMPNRFPDFLCWMPGADAIVRCDKKQDEAIKATEDADLLWFCDMCKPDRVQNPQLEKAILESKAKKVMVDHHLDPEYFCDLTISQTMMSASCEVLCHLMEQLGELDASTLNEATCMYTGMMTDTGAFTFNSNRAVVFECIGKLINRGIDKDRIYRNVFWTATQARMRLTGYLLYVKMEIEPGMNASIMTLTNKERKMLGVKNGDTEGIVNMPLQIQGMKLSCFLSEDTEHPGIVRMSLRSVDDFPCNEMSERYFNGGGHKNAAGGRLQCTIDEAVEKVRKAIREYRSMLE